jgi:prevent-host-death family protein
MVWQLAEAKNKFSEVVTKALTEGPQHISRRGEMVVVLSEEEYQRLTGKRETLIEFLLNGPDWSELDTTRDQSLMREFEW